MTTLPAGNLDSPHQPSIPTTQILYGRFRTLKEELLKAERQEITLTLEEIQAKTREIADIVHTIQSTAATGPKGRKAATPKAAKAPSAGVVEVSADDDLSDL